MLAQGYPGDKPIAQPIGGTMRDDKTLIVRAVWDDEVDVWVATSEDVPGLATEAATLDELMEKLKVMIPELLDENGFDDNGEIPFRLLSEHSAIASRHAGA